MAAETIRDGGKIMLFGNGGSNSDAQHISAELVCRLKDNRRPIAAIALGCEPALATATGNDLGFRHIFARQIAALSKPEDLIIAITTSGNSENVTTALAACAVRGLKTGVFTSKKAPIAVDDNRVIIRVSSDDTARIQEAHIFLGHVFCASLEKELGFA